MQALRGTQDILPDNIYKWNHVESVIKELCALYGYSEIRTPMFEDTKLFLRGIGDTTDVVAKEMYTFEDRGGRSITFYIGSMFRYDRPQAGRYREFHQFGVEVLGASSPAADAEVINLAYTLFKTLGLKELELHINSIGDYKCRPIYRQKLIEFFEEKKDQLCDDCKARLHKNPLRILDCKEDSCRRASAGAPKITDYLCDECEKKFEAVKRYLAALEIPYSVDSRLVRGLDYYTNTAFEIQYPPLGAQSAICGGGRYDGLVEDVGGPSTPGIGFAVGLERLLLALEMQKLIPEPANRKKVYIVTLGEDAIVEGIKIQQHLRDKGVIAEIDLQDRSIKGQMKQADKNNAEYTVIIGANEMEKKEAAVKNMENGKQQDIPFLKVSDFITESSR